MRKILFGIVGLCAILLATPLFAQGELGFVLVVHPENPTTRLSRGEVSQMYLKKLTKWPDEQPVLAVDQPVNARVRETFSKHIHGRAASSVASFWRQQLFSGRGVPVPEKASDDAVLRFVSSNRGAIGYVASTTQLAGVKVLALKD